MGNILETIWIISVRSAISGFILFLVFLGHGLQPPQNWPQSSQQNQAFSDWALTQINLSIYWAWHDVLWINNWLFNWWSQIPSPFKQFAIIVGFIFATENFWVKLKGTILKNKLSVYCPIDNFPGRPIPGTVDRYRCRDGHQFAGEPHDFHYV